MKLKSSQIAFLGIMTVFALMFSYIERLIPPLIPVLPGIKLGLANIPVIVMLYVRGYKAAFTLNIVRILLNGLLFTGIWGIIYAVTGALVSFTIMCIFKSTRRFGTTGVSAVGGVFHNLGQISVAALVLGSEKIYYYVPFLIISGVAAGAVIGYLSGLIINRINWRFL